jgi:hypothetical protein
MLTKNVYILYRPGYSGSYINWAINISDQDTAKNTVTDPINYNQNTQFGGVGTSHYHTRIPTHQDYTTLCNWMLHNQPKTPNIYIVNAGQNRNSIIGNIAQHDATGIVLSIHDNNDVLISQYGYINGILKWPTRIVAQAALKNTTLLFDPYNCKNDITARNWFIQELLESTTESFPVNFDVVNSEIQNYLRWYNVRHQYQPHEVNEQTYIADIDITNRVFELSCYDIITPNFLNILEDIMLRSQVSDNYNLEYLKTFHQKYIDAQSTKQWFSSYKEWQTTGKLDDYLLSHSVIQACVITNILTDTNAIKLLNRPDRWGTFYLNVKDDSWPTCNSEYEFVKLPVEIQEELVNDFDYVPLTASDYSLLEIISLYPTMTIQEINDWYQKYCKSNLVS